MPDFFVMGAYPRELRRRPHADGYPKWLGTDYIVRDGRITECDPVDRRPLWRMVIAQTQRHGQHILIDLAAFLPDLMTEFEARDVILTLERESRPYTFTGMHVTALGPKAVLDDLRRRWKTRLTAVVYALYYRTGPRRLEVTITDCTYRSVTKLIMDHLLVHRVEVGADFDWDRFAEEARGPYRILRNRALTTGPGIVHCADSKDAILANLMA